MKKLFHYVIIFLVIYWCFNNINGCNVTKDIKVPQIEEKGGSCEGCTTPIEEVDTEKGDICYNQLRNAIIKTSGKPKTFVELEHRISYESTQVIVVTIDYEIVNDINEVNGMRSVGTYEFNEEGEMISVDIKETRMK
jgi:uncharacterized membrane protein